MSVRVALNGKHPTVCFGDRFPTERVSRRRRLSRMNEPIATQQVSPSCVVGKWETRKA